MRRGPIAIVGMAGVFPGASDVHRFWQNILAKVDATGDPPPEWEAELYLDTERRSDDRPYCVRGGYLGPLAEFSPSELGVMPSSVDGTEPDHFLALRVAYEALVDAGLAQGRVDRTRTEVILGRGTYVNRGNTNVVQHTVMLDQLVRILKQLHPEHTDEQLAEIRRELKASLPPFNAETAAGLVPNIITGRVANRLDCMGANYIVDAACASSLVALDLAMRDLLDERCDLAIAGGVHASTPPPIVTIFCQLNAISPTGQIRPFDSAADGTLLGEGAGMVVLKRLADAERDGDRIYAVLRGVGVASDGKAVGLLAPRLEGEELALRRAYEAAGVSPASVGLLEAHGTATTLGDSVEVEALTRVFGEGSGDRTWCALGSVKSMIGHLMPASGIAGLIKTALALHHRVLPPTICDSPNPKLGLERSGFYLNTATRPWVHAGSEPRRAGVNAFGFGGINAHAVLEEYTGAAPRPMSSQREWDSELVLVSARSRDELIAEATQLHQQLANRSDVSLKDLAYTQNVARPLEAVRLAVVAASIEDLRAKLARAADRLRQPKTARIRDIDGIYYFSRPLAREGKVAFVFPGEGSQYPRMLADLCMHFREVGDVFDFMDRAFADHPRGYLPSDVMFPRAGDAADRLFGMDGGAEAVFTANQALAALLRALGIRADAMVGHSTGEHSALLASGVVTAADEDELRAHVLGVNAVYEQLQAGAGIPEGLLLATGGIDVATLRDIVASRGGDVHIAMDNCPHQVVLCGTADAIAAISDALAAHRAICQPLPFARAYHTPWFEVFCRPLREYFDRVTVVPPSGVDVYSCITASRFPGEPDAIRELVSTQWARTVRFRETVDAMHADGVRIFVEAGPRANLTGFIDDSLRGREYAAIASNVPHRSGLTQLNHLVGQLVAHGVGVRLARLYQDRAPSAVSLEPGPGGRRKPRMSIKSGLQPMRLPPDFTQVPDGAKTPEQPVTISHALEPSRTARAGVVDAHFETMGRFLELQQQVMSTYLLARGGANGNANGNGHATDRAAKPTAAGRTAPFVAEVLSHQPGQAVDALVRLDVDRHPFFADHTLGRGVSLTDPGLLGLPVLPLTFSIEILAEAASLLAPGRTLLAIEGIRAYRWITVEPAQALVVSARVDAAGGAIGVSARLADSERRAIGPVLIEASVRFGSAYPARTNVPAFSPRDPHASMWTRERLYVDGMFHGPAFQVVRSVDVCGSDGNSATLVTPAPRRLFDLGEEPELLTDAVALDAAGQVLAYWAKETLGPHVDVFPFRVGAIRVLQPPPAPGSRMRCDVRASLVGDTQTRCDIDLVDGRGQAIYRIEGWENRRFELPPSLLQMRIAPRTTAIARPWAAPIAGLAAGGALACFRADSISEEFLDSNHGIWRQMLASLVLSRREREAWAALSGVSKRRHEWLLGRVAAKDAVRHLLKERCGLVLPPADVEIVTDAHGRPEVHVPAADGLGLAPVVSISHSGGVAVALAALDGRALVGIDIERLTARDQSFERIAFTADERKLLDAVPEGPARLEWRLRMWCAKEAAGKALGRGLSAGLHALVVTETCERDGAVRLTLAGSLLGDFPAVGRTGMTAFTTRDGDFVSSAIAGP
jgi:acyl transferase domain-containing protein/phosphopantetheinyl transferase